jgi:hypothetical protein
MTLPSDYDARKAIPLASVLDYFEDALAEVARVIGAGQAQHGTTGWDRAKSKDEESTLLRHFLERGSIDVDGVRHSAKMAWRALALLQKEIEAARGDGKISRGSYDSSKHAHAPGPYSDMSGVRVTFSENGNRRLIGDTIHDAIIAEINRDECLSDGRKANEVARDLLTNPNPGYSPRSG